MPRRCEDEVELGTVMIVEKKSVCRDEMKGEETLMKPMTLPMNLHRWRRHR